MTDHPVVVLQPTDQVATVVNAVPKGTMLTIPGHGGLEALQDVPAGHKIALADVEAGAHVHKYGQPIGVASKPIRRGEHVHVHNLDSDRVGGSRHG